MARAHWLVKSEPSTYGWAELVACQRIVARYNEEGRPFAACDLLKGGDPNDVEVIFNVNAGPIGGSGRTQVNG